MIQKSLLESQEIRALKENLIEYARMFDYACVLDSHSEIFNNYINPSIRYDLVAGYANEGNTATINKLEQLSSIQFSLNYWLLGYLTYDLKNQFEKLESKNPDYLNWPEIFFFQPEILFLLKGNELIKISNQHSGYIYDDIYSYKTVGTDYSLQLNPRITKGEYISHVSMIKEHIQHGDIYEINYCQEFFDTRRIDPYQYYAYLKNYSPSPFAAFFKYCQKYLLSLSPERFLQKTGNILISQPIKGTAPRGINSIEDIRKEHELKTSEKERSENVMIVDLVRNDLSRIARPNSVKVEELCGIYTFPQVHQMISTISAEIPGCDLIDILRATFPMGSMTGAPKIAAMQIAEKHENTKRGLYSGAVGYLTPGMDFDFNVVIRSLQYNAESDYLSYMTGSAITALSDAEKEYEECLLKVYCMNKTNIKANYAHQTS